VHLERRFDPFIRPAFDAVLRDPLAKLVTALINRKRPNEGLKLAEEKLRPDEEAYLDSIIASFERQMRGLWKPWAVRARRKYEDSRHCARGVYRSR
jgi:hypothetical protein